MLELFKFIRNHHPFHVKILAMKLKTGNPRRSTIPLKKTSGILLIAYLAIGLASCGAPTATPTPPSVATATITPAPAVVTFSDPALEAMVRGAMGKPAGDISVAEAQAVTRLNLNDELQRYISEGNPIKDIGGLKAFTNLEYLDLSNQEISDISALAGLTKLTLLSLGGNPVSDISPLAGLTNLKVLILTNAAAQDYSALAALVNLEYLKLDNSTITDVSALASLTELQGLYLANCPVIDYSLLANIYPNLKQKDFIIPSTLEELGFNLDSDRHQALFDSQDASFIIHHDLWGPPPEEWQTNIILIAMYLKDEYKVSFGFYGDLNTYVFMMDKDGQLILNYIYDASSGDISIGEGDRASSEQAIRAAMDVADGEDVLLTPVRIFNETIRKTFNMNADTLYALPYEPPSLKSLGFFPDEANAVCLYEQRGEKDYNIEIHRPEWGEKEYDVRFFTPLSDEYRIVITYNIGERKFLVGGDDNFGGGASFEYYVDTNEYVDGWSSDKAMTVQEYFAKAYNDPAITDVHEHSIELMQQYFVDRFGMTFEELYALPTCE